MDFVENNPALQMQVAAENKIDPTGELQTADEHSWFSSFKSAFRQQREIANPTSESVAFSEFREDVIDKDSNLTDDQKANINYYISNGKSSSDLIDNFVKDGQIKFNKNGYILTGTAAKWLDSDNRRGSDHEKILRGYKEALDNNLTYSQMKGRIVEYTRQKNEEYNKVLSQDTFFDNFGSHFLGATAGWFTDPINTITMIPEIKAFELAGPLLRGISKINKFDWGVAAAKHKEFINPTVDNVAEAKKLFGKYKATVIGTNVGIGATSAGLMEAARQNMAYDWHHEVDPHYDIYQKDEQIGIVALTGGVAGGLVGHMTNKMVENKWQIYKNNQAEIKNSSIVGSETIGENIKNVTKDHISPNQSEFTKLSDEHIDVVVNDLSNMNKLKECLNK